MILSEIMRVWKQNKENFLWISMSDFRFLSKTNYDTPSTSKKKKKYTESLYNMLEKKFRYVHIRNIDMQQE